VDYSQHCTRAQVCRAVLLVGRLVEEAAIVNDLGHVVSFLKAIEDTIRVDSDKRRVPDVVEVQRADNRN